MLDPEILLILFPVNQPEDERQQNADQQACCQWKVNGNVLATEIKIPGQPADPLDFPSQQK